jgi:hypothetical protein
LHREALLQVGCQDASDVNGLSSISLYMTNASGVAFTLNIEAIQSGVEALTGGSLWDPAMRVLSRIPATLNPWNVVAATAMALGLSFLATLYPAWRAARLDPVEAQPRQREEATPAHGVCLVHLDQLTKADGHVAQRHHEGSLEPNPGRVAACVHAEPGRRLCAAWPLQRLVCERRQCLTYLVPAVVCGPHTEEGHRCGKLRTCVVELLERSPNVAANFWEGALQARDAHRVRRHLSLQRHRSCVGRRHPPAPPDLDTSSARSVGPGVKIF